MKIVFLCGSLTKGRDGVGDYTRMLAFELIKKGHQVGAVSLNDRHVETVADIVETDGNFQMPVLQIPAILSSDKKYTLAANWVSQFNPEWVSFQFVIYSFHPKGLPFYLGEKLKTITAGRKVHIMFHEIWVGFTSISPLKHKLTGRLQQKIIRSIISVLSPQKISTTNYLYHLVLQDKKIENEIIPLFSNIPLVKLSEQDRNKQLAELIISDEKRNDFFITGIFGNLYPEANLQQIISDQLTNAVKQKKKLVFLGFGRMNESGLSEFDRLKSLFSCNVKFIHLGEVSPEKASGIFQVLDNAISCTPGQHIGKSGVFAALKLHGVPVIISKGDFIPEYQQRTTNYYKSFVNRPAADWNVTAVAKLYLNFLS